MKYNYKVFTDKAYELHLAGRLDEAAAMYKKLISKNPDDVNVLNLYGLLLMTKRNYEEAVTYLSKAVLYKKDAYVISNLAKAYYLLSEFKKSAKMYQTALKYEKNDDTYYSLALAYKKMNKIEECIDSYKKAVEINPKNLSAYYNLILMYSDSKRYEEAIECGLEACRNNENADEIYSLLSGLYENQGQTEEAVIYLQKAVEASPKDYLYYYNLGVLYAKLKKIDEAVENYRKALLINPKHIESYVNIASLYNKKKQPEIARQYLEIAYESDKNESIVVLSLAQTYKDLYQNDKSIELLEKLINSLEQFPVEENNTKLQSQADSPEKINKNIAEAFNLTAMNYMDKGAYDIAIQYYDKALERDSENISYKYGKAVACKYQGDIELCKQMLEEIIKSGNADSQTKITLGMIYLQNKDLKKGFELYSERNNDTAFVEVFKDKIYKIGDDISDKTVLLYSNCGLGDTIMYSRFFNTIKEQCKSVILQTDSALANIMRENFPDIKVINKSVSQPDFDVAVPVMDLQYFLDIDFEKIQSQAYLNVDDKLSTYYAKEVFSGINKPKIGLCWQGNKKIFKNRSVDFSYIEEFIKDERFEYYSFQVQDDAALKPGIKSLKKYIGNYGDTAALLKNIDLMITVDSSIAHMAGALGVKTYLLLPFTAEWRWFYDTDKTIWYNSVKIFKQKKPGNWTEVFERIKAELNKNENQ